VRQSSLPVWPGTARLLSSPVGARLHGSPAGPLRRSGRGLAGPTWATSHLRHPSGPRPVANLIAHSILEIARQLGQGGAIDEYLSGCDSVPDECGAQAGLDFDQTPCSRSGPPALSFDTPTPSLSHGWDRLRATQRASRIAVGPLHRYSGQTFFPCCAAAFHTNGREPRTLGQALCLHVLGVPS